MSAWNNLDRPLILASRSPRRRMLLAQMGLSFDSAVPDLDNEAAYIDSGNLSGSLQTLAAAKAMTVARNHPQAIVLGMDTVVVLDGRVLGKPLDRTDALTTLTSLSGKTHSVHTAVALICRGCGFESTTIAQTSVTFRLLSGGEIEDYLDTGSHADKAGAYGIQDRAMIFVDSITGCFYNVMGLPVTATIGLFKQYATKRDGTDV